MKLKSAQKRIIGFLILSRWHGLRQGNLTLVLTVFCYEAICFFINFAMGFTVVF